MPLGKLQNFTVGFRKGLPVSLGARTLPDDREIAEALYEQAKSSQLELTLSLGDESELELDGFESLTQSQAKQLKANDISTQEELAELAVDELTEIIPISAEAAGKIILAARAPWFDNADNTSEQN